LIEREKQEDGVVILLQALVAKVPVHTWELANPETPNKLKTT
jgi:hypothetical protein